MPKYALCVLLISLFASSVSAQEGTPGDELKLAKLSDISESDTMLMVPMRDGVSLATDVYMPKADGPWGEGPFPVIFVKTPYNFNKLAGSSLDLALEAIEHGYAFVVQNERGRYYSEGEWEILGHPQTDGYDSLGWIAEQEWSTVTRST